MGAESEFDVDTGIEPAGDHVFRATVTDRWHTFAGPNGGYLLAICTRAVTSGLPFADPLAVSAHFLRPPKVGSAEIRTETVRVGRRHATARASLFQDDREIVHTIGTFTDLDAARGRTLLLGAPPDLPPPEEAVDPMQRAPEGLPRPSLAERLEYRVAGPPGWLQGEPTGDPSSEFWLRFKDGRRADPLALTFLVDSAPPAVLEIGEFASSTIELTVHVRARPASEWLAFRQSTRYVVAGYHDEDVEIWDADGTLVAQARQIALLG